MSGLERPAEELIARLATALETTSCEKQSVEDLLAALVIELDLHGELGPAGRRLMERFEARAGISRVNDLDERSRIAARYVLDHPLPKELVTLFRDIACEALAHAGAIKSEQGRAFMGRASWTRPVEGHASRESSLFQLRLKPR